jgi:hypothetical protein
LKFLKLQNRFHTPLTVNSNKSVLDFLKSRSNDLDWLNLSYLNFLKSKFSKILNYDKLLLKNINYSGKSIKMVGILNKVCFYILKNFFKKSKFLEKKFPSYSVFYNFSQSNDYFFDINFILSNISNLNEPIFITKVVKIDKKSKKIIKSKSKFDFELKYLKKHKRVPHVMKSLCLFSNNFNYYTFEERLLTSVLTTLLEQKNSEMFKKKVYTYNSALKKKYKKTKN